MEKTDRKETIKAIYFYLASFVGLVLIIIGSIQLIKLGITTWVFPQADEIAVYPAYKLAPEEAPEETEKITPAEREVQRQEMIEYQEKERSNRRQRTATNAIAMIIVGIPLYLYHWKTIQKTKKDKKIN
jgi:hypothetical protein